MLKRTDILNEKMLNDLRVVGDFQCGKWSCYDCPFKIDFGSGCVSIEIKGIIDRYDAGEEVIFNDIS